MDKTTKKNFQAREYIMNIILSSPIGTKLPSERELMSHLNFSRPTIQHAIDDLLLDGYLYRVKRQGTFIANNFRSTNLNRISSFNEAARELGVSRHGAVRPGDCPRQRVYGDKAGLPYGNDHPLLPSAAEARRDTRDTGILLLH